MGQNILKMDVKDIGRLLLRDKGGKKVYPTKTTLNLGEKPKSINSPSRAIPLFLFLLLCIAAFSKFAVADKLAEAVRAEAIAMQAENELAAIRGQTADYENVRAEYDRRVFPALMMEDAMRADAMEILEMLETRLMPQARVRAFSVQEPVITLQLSGVSLRQTAHLVKTLESSPLVASVMVYTAGTEETPAPTPTPTPTPTPKPTRTPRHKKGQTPAPTETPAPSIAPTATPEAPASVSMTIILKQGGEG
ncbi:MAG: hypothetical protein PHC80_06745 [Eubacteriales bacterium]|nr:hypothetical protein [Eubacteriales bacterium]